MARIIIFANGLLPDIKKASTLIQADDFILCADGGTRHALSLGLRPSLIVGDLDSLSNEDKTIAESTGAQIVRYPHDKNETDLELAINHALERKPTSIIILAALGNRLDQTLGNIALLSEQRLAALDVRIDDGLEEAFFCRERSELHGKSGDIVSLIPWEGAVEGIRTEGLKWPLQYETLYPEKSRGISNELVGTDATVNLTAGLLLIIHRRQ